MAVTNLQRWEQSGKPQQWVREHIQGWDHQAWLSLLASLRNSEYWPMDEAAMSELLETTRDRFRQETRTTQHGQASMSGPGGGRRRG